MLAVQIIPMAPSVRTSNQSSAQPSPAALLLSPQDLVVPTHDAHEEVLERPQQSVRTITSRGGAESDTGSAVGSSRREVHFGRRAGGGSVTKGTATTHSYSAVSASDATARWTFLNEAGMFSDAAPHHQQQQAGGDSQEDMAEMLLRRILQGGAAAADTNTNNVGGGALTVQQRPQQVTTMSVTPTTAAAIGATSQSPRAPSCASVQQVPISHRVAARHISHANRGTVSVSELLKEQKHLGVQRSHLSHPNIIPVPSPMNGTGSRFNASTLNGTSSFSDQTQTLTTADLSEAALRQQIAKHLLPRQLPNADGADGLSAEDSGPFRMSPALQGLSKEVVPSSPRHVAGPTGGGIHHHNKPTGLMVRPHVQFPNGPRGSMKTTDVPHVFGVPPPNSSVQMTITTPSTAGRDGSHKQKPHLALSDDEGEGNSVLIHQHDEEGSSSAAGGGVNNSLRTSHPIFPSSADASGGQMTPSAATASAPDTANTNNQTSRRSVRIREGHHADPTPQPLFTAGGNANNEQPRPLLPLGTTTSAEHHSPQPPPSSTQHHVVSGYTARRRNPPVNEDTPLAPVSSRTGQVTGGAARVGDHPTDRNELSNSSFRRSTGRSSSGHGLNGSTRRQSLPKGSHHSSSSHFLKEAEQVPSMYRYERQTQQPDQAILDLEKCLHEVQQRVQLQYAPPPPPTLKRQRSNSVMNDTSMSVANGRSVNTSHQQGNNSVSTLPIPHMNSGSHFLLAANNITSEVSGQTAPAPPHATPRSNSAIGLIKPSNRPVVSPTLLKMLEGMTDVCSATFVKDVPRQGQDDVAPKEEDLVERVTLQKQFLLYHPLDEICIATNVPHSLANAVTKTRAGVTTTLQHDGATALPGVGATLAQGSAHHHNLLTYRELDRVEHRQWHRVPGYVDPTRFVGTRDFVERSVLLTKLRADQKAGELHFGLTPSYSRIPPPLIRDEEQVEGYTATAAPVSYVTGNTNRKTQQQKGDENEDEEDDSQTKQTDRNKQQPTASESEGHSAKRPVVLSTSAPPAFVNGFVQVIKARSAAAAAVAALKAGAGPAAAKKAAATAAAAFTAQTTGTNATQHRNSVLASTGFEANLPSKTQNVAMTAGGGGRVPTPPPTELIQMLSGGKAIPSPQHGGTFLVDGAAK